MMLLWTNMRACLTYESLAYIYDKFVYLQLQLQDQALQ